MLHTYNRGARSEDFKEFLGQPTVIRFTSFEMSDRRGNMTRYSVAVHVEDGDVMDFLATAMKTGFVSSVSEDGSLLLLPVPGCVMEIYLDDGSHS